MFGTQAPTPGNAEIRAAGSGTPAAEGRDLPGRAAVRGDLPCFLDDRTAGRLLTSGPFTTRLAARRRGRPLGDHRPRPLFDQRAGRVHRRRDHRPRRSPRTAARRRSPIPAAPPGWNAEATHRSFGSAAAPRCGRPSTRLRRESSGCPHLSMLGELRAREASRSCRPGWPKVASGITPPAILRAAQRVDMMAHRAKSCFLTRGRPCSPTSNWW